MIHLHGIKCSICGKGTDWKSIKKMMNQGMTLYYGIFSFSKGDFCYRCLEKKNDKKLLFAADWLIEGQNAMIAYDLPELSAEWLDERQAWLKFQITRQKASV
jgi:hypothetical protein